MSESAKMIIAVFLDRAQHPFNHIPQYMYSLVADPIETLQSLCKANYLTKVDESNYALTTSGKMYLLEHKDYVEFFHDSNTDFDLEEYVAAKQALPFKGTYNDVLWSIYNKRQLSYRASHDEDGLTMNYFNMFKVLRNESRFEDAMQQMVNYLYCSLSQLDRANMSREEKISDEAWIPPSAGVYLHKHKEFFDWSMADNCLAIPLAKPPSMDRFISLLAKYVNK